MTEYYFKPMKLPSEYRQQIYVYVEDLLGRPLTYEEHDTLRAMMLDYLFSTQNLRVVARRIFCHHEWVSDRQIEGGQNAKAYLKCRKCDKRTRRKLPLVADY